MTKRRNTAALQNAKRVPRVWKLRQRFGVRALLRRFLFSPSARLARKASPKGERRVEFAANETRGRSLERWN
jgi:hypothetical protein